MVSPFDGSVVLRPVPFGFIHCFPLGEPPTFHWMAEVETAAAVPCPLHGVRFDAIERPVVYEAKWHRPEDYATVEWTYHSPQYSKAWRASFPPNLWPADERWQFQPEHRITLILQDGTELSCGGLADEWRPEKLEALR
jgi:hypothetical protein